MQNKYKIALLLALLVILFIVFLFALSIGRIEVSLSDALKYLIFNDNSKEALLINDIRFPRILAAIVVGGALALSGGLYQGVIGNPLVSPSILGVLNGASFGAALGMILGYGILGVEILSFIFGILAMCIALALSFIFDRGAGILMLILGGIITSAFFGAGVSLLKMLADPYNTLPNIIYWLLGSLTFIDTFSLLVLCIISLCSVIICVLLAKYIDILNLDSHSAMSLGVNVILMRLVFIVIATLLASSSVAVGGLIGWVGLVVPHIARYIMGANHHFSLSFAFLFGGLFLLFCDTLARSIANVEIPLGIITAILGIPIFVAILIFNKSAKGY